MRRRRKIAIILKRAAVLQSILTTVYEDQRHAKKHSKSDFCFGQERFTQLLSKKKPLHAQVFENKQAKKRKQGLFLHTFCLVSFICCPDSLGRWLSWKKKTKKKNLLLHFIAKQPRSLQLPRGKSPNRRSYHIKRLRCQRSSSTVSIHTMPHISLRRWLSFCLARLPYHRHVVLVGSSYPFDWPSRLQ